MNFRQILLNHNPIDSKNKLNNLLAEVERNFGVFSPDMELDIRAVISKNEVKEYFDRIIHDPHPKLEHDQVATSPNIQESKQRTHKSKQRKKGLKKSTLELEDERRANKTKEELIAANRSRVGSYHPNPVFKTSTSIAKARRKIEEEKEMKERMKGYRISIISIPMGGQNKKH